MRLRGVIVAVSAIAFAAPAAAEGAAVTNPQIAGLQVALRAHGLYKGEVDGKLGAETRGSVKLAQQRHGLPADSYPTAELVARLRRIR
jgi:peptidoglycan hydrolase-like protein with peptidoglycan-binding domain